MSYDAVVIGSGAGGGTVTRALAEQGKKILLIERGDWLPREPAGWSAEEIFGHGRYRAQETWLDRDGKEFHPGEYYNVGGKTKFYGSALFRLRDRDFRSWPVTPQDMAPWYDQAENWYHVHTMEHSPVIQKIADRFTAAGLHPEHAPCGVIEGTCSHCDMCDGFPCPVLGKADAQTCGVQPALDTGNVTLLTGTQITRLVHYRGQIIGLEGISNGQEDVLGIDGIPVILAAGAVNSAALWLRSDLPDVSGQAGRNYMCHRSQAVLAIGRDRLPPAFHKTLTVMDWYPGLGSIQMAGQPKAAMLRGESFVAQLAPELTLREIAERSVTFWLMSEDQANPQNTVTWHNSSPMLNYLPDGNAVINARMLYRRLAALLPGMGFHAHLRKVMPLAAVAHQCGTLRMGTSAQDGVVDAEGKAWGLGNLFVADASVFPSSGAVNPALTVMAHALRVASSL
jgi:choline dehydrogenase-like flavoprotein